jgi:hypothetical protein
MTAACTASDISTLGKLNQLQELVLMKRQAPNSHRNQLLSPQLLAKLTVLTTLQVAKCAPSELQYVSCCTGLQVLQFVYDGASIGAAEPWLI